MHRKTVLLANRSFRWILAGLPAVLGVGMLIAAGTGIKAAPAVGVLEAQPALHAASPAAVQDVQVAEEIIRELRRLGLNLVPDRIDRPYDPKGELC